MSLALAVIVSSLLASIPLVIVLWLLSVLQFGLVTGFDPSDPQRWRTYLLVAVPTGAVVLGTSLWQGARVLSPRRIGWLASLAIAAVALAPVFAAQFVITTREWGNDEQVFMTAVAVALAIAVALAQVASIRPPDRSHSTKPAA
jgi:hypothetical protein